MDVGGNRSASISKSVDRVKRLDVGGVEYRCRPEQVQSRAMIDFDCGWIDEEGVVQMRTVVVVVAVVDIVVAGAGAGSAGGGRNRYRGS